MNTHEDSVKQTIHDYDSQGWHRTATAGDEHCATWLRKELALRGLESTEQRFDLQRLDPGQARLEANGLEIDGVPLFDGGLTGSEGITGAVGPLGSEAPVGFCELPVHGPHAEFDASRQASSHQVIVAAINTQVPGQGLRNAYAFGKPFGPPVLQVAGEQAHDLRELASRKTEARVWVCGRHTPSKAANIMATLPGQEPALPPLLVLTPRSGWWQCAGERGGGLACWLHVAGALARSQHRRTVHFVASSGHELGHFGLSAYLAAHPGLDAGAHAWLHLGASIGAAQHPRLRQYNSDQPLAALARDALREAGATGHEEQPLGILQSGEASNIHRAGGRYISLAGNSDWFHLPQDRYPEAVDFPALARYAKAMEQIAFQLVNNA